MKKRLSALYFFVPRKLRSKKYVAAVLVLTISSILLLNVDNYGKIQTNVDASCIANSCVQKQSKLILFYTTMWNSKLWPGFQTSKRFNNWGGIPCSERSCVVTYNKNLVSKADVIVFHAFGFDMVSETELQRISAKRHQDQIWIYFMHECPHNAWPSPANFNGFFNWTMNYRRDADITVPYNWEWGTWEKIYESKPRKRVKDYSHGKDRLVYGMISHCGVIREKYIRKLQEYIPVHIYGKCSKRFHEKPKTCQRNSKACAELKKRYKFFLAFENSFCVDYITEKFHETLLDGNAVPIVLGGADYQSLAITKSYINVFDFRSVQALADFLKFLDQNNDAYNEYQKWRQNYRLGKPKSWSCEICRMANEKKLLRKTYQDLGGWYAVENNCATGVKQLRQIMINSNISGPYTDEYYKT